jgi:hypothetical protein
VVATWTLGGTYSSCLVVCLSFRFATKVITTSESILLIFCYFCVE